MKSIFSESQLRKVLLEALGWEIVGQSMWTKKSDVPAPEERVDEDEVLEMEQKRIARIQEVFEALVDEPGPIGSPENESVDERISKILEMIARIDPWVSEFMNQTSARLESLELSSTAWRVVNGRLITVEEQIKMIFNVFESLRLTVMKTITSAFTTQITKNEKARMQSAATEVRTRKDG